MGLAVPPNRNILVSDFDGTLTRRDFYQLVQERLPPQSGFAVWEDYSAGRISHFDALRTIFAAFRAGEAELTAWQTRWDSTRTWRPTWASLRAAGWEVVVASGGCAWYIHRLLTEAGVHLEVHANPGASRTVV